MLVYFQDTLICLLNTEISKIPYRCAVYFLSLFLPRCTFLSTNLLIIDLPYLCFPRTFFPLRIVLLTYLGILILSDKKKHSSNSFRHFATEKNSLYLLLAYFVILSERILKQKILAIIYGCQDELYSFFQSTRTLWGKQSFLNVQVIPVCISSTLSTLIFFLSLSYPE